MTWIASICRSRSDTGAGIGSGQERLAARFARTAGPPPAAHGEHAVPAHHHYKPSGAPVGLIVGVVAAGLAAIVILVGILASRGSTPTLSELKAKLGIAPGANVDGVKVSQVDFMNRLGTPDHEDKDPTYLFFYYPVQEGTAIIVVERGGWEVGEARIRQIYVR